MESSPQKRQQFVKKRAEDQQEKNGDDTFITRGSENPNILCDNWWVFLVLFQLIFTPQAMKPITVNLHVWNRYLSLMLFSLSQRKRAPEENVSAALQPLREECAEVRVLWTARSKSGVCRPSWADEGHHRASQNSCKWRWLRTTFPNAIARCWLTWIQGQC